MDALPYLRECLVESHPADLHAFTGDASVQEALRTAPLAQPRSSTTGARTRLRVRPASLVLIDDETQTPGLS